MCIRDRYQRRVRGASQFEMSEGAEGENKVAEPSKQEVESAIINQFQKLKTEKNELSSKMAEIKMDKNEHEMCIKTMAPFDASRKCWRLVGGVLVERTVGEVLPAIKENVANIDELLAKLDKMHDDKESEMIDFMKKYNIVVKGQVAPDQAPAAPVPAVEGAAAEEKPAEEKPAEDKK
eukprot:TRINITY_DN19021_c0_g1_i2.p1 TRINITY_DN19021_c0_g1~~TRINITY_DN19021_c0_g1_i2.p1  ORF type:complete len:178 (+),score=68.96 TRINITY_DN19021_c0_g1_i2:132-665(+)